MNIISPAKQYSHTNDLWIVSCFYNSNSYVTKPKNYNTFIEKIEAANLNYLIVECAFGNQPFTLTASKKVVQVRAPDIMWQKERLLNIAIEKLPAKCKKVAWIDCDVLFENPDWAMETAAQLKYHKFVQPFKEAIRLPKNAEYYNGDGDRYLSFGYVIKNNPYILTEGKFELHGHTGFAWASHTSLIKKHGLYDACIAGTADHVMAHAFAGDWNTNCVKRVFGDNTAFYEHYKSWSAKIYEQAKSKISYVDGALLHLWHGDIKNREYSSREKMLIKHMFNPVSDIKLNAQKCWGWNHDNVELINWAKEYFVLRKED
jgi:hypothetical protein